LAKRRKKGRAIKTYTLGRVEVTTYEIDNPDWDASRDGLPGFPRRISAALNMRESPAMWMYVHGQIDHAHMQAASEFRRLHEMAGGAGIQAIDTTKEPVDGRSHYEPITDAMMLAARKLRQAHAVLGPERYRLVEAVCGDCVWIKDLADTRRGRSAMADLLRDCLDVLAEDWGYRTRRRVAG